MDDGDLFLLLSVIVMTTAGFALSIRKKSRKRIRRYGVRPINRNRRKLGLFENFVKAMINCDREYFYKYTRMSPEMFSHLLKLVEPKLEKAQCTKDPITAAQRLIMTLHYLSEGCSQQEIAFVYYVGPSTVSGIIRETVQVIYETLQPIVMPVPTTEDWLKIAAGFYNRWNIPNCIGAVDGKHVSVKCPAKSGTRYHNYKKHFSLVLMAACDAYYKFTAVDVGGEGSNPDGAIFRNSGFGDLLLRGKLNLSKPKSLPGSNVTLPHFVVADAAFPLHTNIMRPYPGNFLGVEKNVFNYRLSRARRVIENTFGILTQRWRIYFVPIDALIDTCENIVLCTVVLHNYIQKSEEDIPLKERKYCPTGYVDSERDGEIVSGGWRVNKNPLKKAKHFGSNNSKRLAQDNRDLLKDWFLSPAGSVPWQLNYVLRGSVPESFMSKN